MAPTSGFFTLLTQRRFAPLFFTQFLGAFVDNVFRSSLLILVTFNQALAQGHNRSLIAALVGGIFILPFFLFSSLAGQVADKFEKARLVMIIKGTEMIITGLIVYALFSQSFYLLMIVLFLNMTQTTFFGPLKYSLIPFYLKGGEIITGNALVESSTFIAILFGSIVGGIAVSIPHYSLHVVSFIMVISSLMAWVSSWYLLESSPADPSLKIDPNLYTTSLQIIRSTMQDRRLYLSIIGISWFWVVGNIILTQIAPYGKNILGGNQFVITFFLFLFTLGIGLGSFLCKILSREKIDPRHVVWGSVGMTLFILDLVLASHGMKFTDSHEIGLSQFLFRSPYFLTHWRIIVDLMMIAVCGGLFTVPLYTLIQTDSQVQFRSRTIAANNILNALFMVVSSVVSMILIAINVSILNLFLITGFLNIYLLHRISDLLPTPLLRLFVQGLLKLFFRVEVKGLENFYASGNRTLIIANHTSFLDAILVYAFVSSRINFAVYSPFIDKWWLRIVKRSVNLFPLDPTNPLATKHLIEFLKQDKQCLIFPEGRITVTGSLMKIYDGPGMVADRAGATILPIRIEGAQYSLFSRLSGVVRRKLFPKITLTILPAQIITADPSLKGKERRRIMSSKVYDIMAGMLFETSEYHLTLFSSLIEAARTHGMRRIIGEDITQEPLCYRSLLIKAFILGRSLSERTVIGERVGIFLPTSLAALVGFMGLHSIGRTPAMLNYSLGLHSLLETCSLARVRLIITSRLFIEKAQMGDIVSKLAENSQILYLEDLRDQISLREKMRGLISSYIPEMTYRSTRRLLNPEDGAVILFTSGSEGQPKCVALSHVNLNANRFQIKSSIDFTPQDVVLNVLPMFHSFGLTGGTLVPLLEGVRSYYYPTPLHYRRIPAIAYEINATIFFATDTFLSRYGRLAHPYDFYSTRYVFAGAEKLQPETRQLWIEKFGIQILEAYGTTETAPTLSMSTRMYNKLGSVGRFLPAVQRRLKPIEGIPIGGELFVKGPNVMLGYISPETGKVTPTSSLFDSKPEEGWYDTGDVASIDEQGFVTILGRMKRFAKVGGEMISLVALEDRISSSWPDHKHVVLAFPYARKGEQLVLLTTGHMLREEMNSSLKSQGLTELYFPRKIFTVDHIPLLATGKVDLRGSKAIAESLMRESDASPSS